MAIRSFKLTNKNGITWDLNSQDAFFYDVSGLGQERNIDYETVGTAFLPIFTSIKQPNPKGSIFFKNYAKSNEFSKFIQFSPLTLSYKMPTVETEYFMEVNVENLSKDEMVNGGVERKISFVGNGLFYRLETVENESIASAGKTYPYTYPYTYSDNLSGSVAITSDSDISSPCKITIFGPCENPSWIHYVNDTSIMTGKVNCTVESGNRLVIDTTVMPYSIKQFNQSMEVVEDCYADSDFSTERFVRLQYGENEISFVHDGTEPLHLIAEGRIIYESV